jgi:hypothetical protein
MLTVPVLQYISGTVNWRFEKPKKMDRQTRNMLTIYGLLQPRAGIASLRVRRKEEKRLIQAEGYVEQK